MLDPVFEVAFAISHQATDTAELWSGTCDPVAFQRSHRKAKELRSLTLIEKPIHHTFSLASHLTAARTR